MKTKLVFILLMLFSLNLAQDRLAIKVITSVTKLMSPENMKSTGTQTITTSSGKSRTFEFESYMGGRGKSTLTRYTKPAAIRGQAFLTLNNADDIWTYFPRTKRVRKLASHAKKQKVQGSDFTYEDMGGGDVFIKKFTPEYEGDETINGDLCWKIDLIGIPDQDPPYPKITLWSRKSDYSPVQLDYYDDHGFNSKSLSLSDIQNIEGLPTAMKMVMVDHKEHSSTTMETLEVTYSWVPPKNFFSERSLKK
ncbi:MAG: outer membrane lipoprotein-sorting protein [Candidatus Marinimicrobia bacterium]|nr:outer membrane lipoprotein-sorting protein [Candidatus Neomarinimicrobiota bacterium]